MDTLFISSETNEIPAQLPESKSDKENPQEQDTSDLISNLNRFSRQKPGGFFEPIIKESLQNCILCSANATCLGPYCLGPGSPSKRRRVSAPVCTASLQQSVQPVCPGLLGGPALTSLVELQQDSSTMYRQSPKSSVLPLGKIFGWSKSKFTKLSDVPSLSNKGRCKSNKAPSRQCVSTTISNNCSTAVYERRRLQALLLRCGAQMKSRKKQCKSFDLQPSSSSLSSSITSATDSSLFSPSILFRHGDPEILRTSPRRRASVSPKTPIRNKSRGHTPRKDTPRKIQKVQCRNTGCRDWFTSDRARERHEKQACRFLPDQATVQLEVECPVPSHVDLQLSPLQCRFPGCEKQYVREEHRKRHEMDRHRMFEKRGRTVSPCFPPPLQAVLSRPQSCPPPPTEPLFLTPERPSKRRRVTPASSTSSLLDSPTSPLPSPTLTITPQSSDHSSETESDNPDNSESENNNNECRSCLFNFRNKLELKRHHCNFNYNPNYCRQNFITPVFLSPPLEVEETRNLLSQLCVEDQVRLCELQGWCLPSIYPLCFSYRQRSGRQGAIPLLSSFTASSESLDILRKLVKIRGEVILPKNIVIKDKERGISAFISIEILTPPSKVFNVAETASHFVVSKHIEEVNDSQELSEDCPVDISSDSDLSDVVYACLGPEPYDCSDYDSDAGTTLPSPPYTPYHRTSIHCHYTRENTDRDNNDENAGPVDGQDDGDYEGDIGRQDESDGFEAQCTGGGGGDDGGGSSDDNGGSSDDNGGGEERDGRDNNDRDDYRDHRDDDNDDDSCNDRDNVDDDDNERTNSAPRNSLLSPALLALLPRDFHPGDDGMGARSLQQLQAASYFRKPWLFPDKAIQALIKHTKQQFFNLVLTGTGSRARRSPINVFSECFLFLLKLSHQLSFDVIAVLFALPDKSIGSRIFYRQLVNQYLRNSNIPAIIQNNETNEEEMNKLLHNSYERTPTFFKTLLANFEDPSGRNRLPVCLNIDATYIDVQGSDDIELQKHFFYSQRSGHTVKVLNFSDLGSKIVGLLPVASSQSPSSGDGLLISKHIELQESSESGHYVRSILRGNDRYFVILVVDAGFVCLVPNAPSQAQGPSLADVCVQENAVLLHTSSKYEKYHLEISDQGKIRKTLWTPGKPTLDENVVKFTRLFRKIQEQVHAGLKAMSRIFDMRHLWNSSLLPFTPRQLRAYNLHPVLYKNTPRLNFIVTVCCSRFNAVHPGYLPLYMGEAQQSRSAESLLARLFLENPLLYTDIWPVGLDAPRRDSSWQEISFEDLEENDILGFPILHRDLINPVAIDIVSGPHALVKADSLLTYMHQLIIKGLDLTREEAACRLQSFPTAWTIQYLDLKTPEDFQPTDQFPRYCPDWWNEEQFGPWYDMRLVRCQIPPSYKSASTRSNFHWAVIGFGTEPIARMGFLPPYDRIYFFRCFKCPAKNGSMSMDRHLATLLKALSFPGEYRSTAKSVNVLNTVAETNRQATDILPPSNSVTIPPNITRRSQNRRSTCPLYSLSLGTSTGSIPARQALFQENDVAPPSDETNDVADSPQTESTVSVQNRPSQPHHPPSASQTRGVSDDPSPMQDTSSPPCTSTASGTVNATERFAQPPRPQVRRRQSSRADPDSELSRHVSLLDPMGLYSLPDASQTRPSTSVFGIGHLQLPGLLNDGNVCGLISLLLSFNRIQILDHLMDPHFCFTAVHTPDYPSLVLFKIFSAMPSVDPFSIQLLILSWNRSGKQPSILPGFIDTPTLAEALVTNMQLKQYASRPVFTKYLASFNCTSCGKSHEKVKNWEGQLGAIPLLHLPPNNQTANINQMFASYLTEPFQTRCQNHQCGARFLNGQLEADIGHFTLIALNRFDASDHKRMNKVELLSNDSELVGSQALGELVSCVCHRGDVNHGHFVSYHKVGDVWYLNDDSQPCRASEDPLLQTRRRSETVDLLFFANNV